MPARPTPDAISLAQSRSEGLAPCASWRPACSSSSLRSEDMPAGTAGVWATRVVVWQHSGIRGGARHSHQLLLQRFLTSRIKRRRTHPTLCCSACPLTQAVCPAEHLLEGNVVGGVEQEAQVGDDSLLKGGGEWRGRKAVAGRRCKTWPACGLSDGG